MRTIYFDTIETGYIPVAWNQLAQEMPPGLQYMAGTAVQSVMHGVGFSESSGLSGFDSTPLLIPDERDARLFKVNPAVESQAQDEKERQKCFKLGTASLMFLKGLSQLFATGDQTPLLDDAKEQIRRFEVAPEQEAACRRALAGLRGTEAGVLAFTARWEPGKVVKKMQVSTHIAAGVVATNSMTLVAFSRSGKLRALDVAGDLVRYDIPMQRPVSMAEMAEMGAGMMIAAAR